MKRIAIVLSVLVLAACQRSAEEPAPVAEDLHVRVQAHYLERIMLPPGSWLQAELFDEQADALVAAQRMDDAISPPFVVELTVASGSWQPDGEYRLYLTLNLPDGRPRFSAEVAVAADQPDLGEVRLVAVDLHEAERESLSWVAYRCGEVPVDFMALDDAAMLVLPWADIELEQVVSASGARYAGQDVEFWTRGQDEARLSIGDEEAQACRRSESLSPWTRARERGVHFRATGNEPGWLVEIGRGDQPSVSLSLDYGSRMLDFDEASWDEARLGLKADSPGNHLELTVTESDCVDTMVGWIFPIRVDMRLNEVALVACGRFLEEMSEE